MTTTVTADVLNFDGGTLGEVFPFHLAFGRDWIIRACGTVLTQVCPAARVGAHFADAFETQSPEGALVFEDLLTQAQTLFLIREKAGGLVLRGQMLPQPGGGLVVFLASPWVVESFDLQKLALCFGDCAIHDPAPDRLHILQGRSMAVADRVPAKEAGKVRQEDPPPLRSSEAEPAATAPPKLHAKYNPLLAKLRILVADDFQMNRRLCLLHLKNYGCICDSVTNGAEAVAAVRREDYDLILMDCHMPEMDGYQATREIRKIEARRPDAKSRRTRIVALTAYAIEGERERCLGMGMDEFLSKPFTSAQLEAAIVKVCADLAGSVKATEPELPDFSAVMARLCDEIGEEPAVSLVSDFADEIPGHLQALRDSHARGDTRSLRIHAHSLRGISANLGHREMASAFEQIENAASSGDKPACGIGLLALEASLARALPAMKQWLCTKPARALAG